MVKPTAGGAGASVHSVSISTASIQQVNHLAGQLLAQAQAANRAAGIYATMGPAYRSLASRFADIAIDASNSHKKTIRDMNVVMARAARTAEGVAIRKVTASKTRADQPAAFLNLKGRPTGKRVRLRDSVSVGLESSGQFDYRIHIGLMADLKKAVDKRGHTIWQAVEEGYSPSTKLRSGFFFTPGGPTAAGAATNQAVFVAGKGGAPMKPRKAFGGYWFLAAGLASADRIVAAGLPKVSAAATARLKVMERRVTALIREAGGIAAKEKNRAKYQRRQSRRTS